MPVTPGAVPIYVAIVITSIKAPFNYPLYLQPADLLPFIKYDKADTKQARRSPGYPLTTYSMVQTSKG